MTQVIEGVSTSLRQRMETFLYREARLLDERRVVDWLRLCTEDIHYVIPTRKSVVSSRPNYERPVAEEFDVNYFHVDDRRAELEIRIGRLTTSAAWAEDPPSRTTRMITNVEVEPGGSDSQHLVRSCVLLQRLRDDHASTVVIYRREDQVRETDDGLRLAGRRVLLDHTIWPFHTMSLIL